ncbi:MAG TPA: 3'-5' exonuclease, partial [Bacteroidia bacterium]|nr:3'-5' exonuclease [Bacteroidia bacterium]
TTLDETLQNRTGISAILKNANFEFSVTHLSKMALYELCEELVRIFKLNSTPNAYIQFFLDEVLNYSIKKNNNLNDFIEYWEEKKEKASLIIPQAMDALSIMTIHRSKGLEFPVVILPFSNTEKKNGKKNLWIDIENEKLPKLSSAIVPTNKSLEETEFAHLYQDEQNKSLLDNLNVMYVGFTRAEERMYVLSGMPSKNPSNFSSVSDMLAYYYQSNNEWAEGKNIYTFGKEVAHKQSAKQKETLNFELLTFNSNRWRESIKMRAAAPSIWNTNMAEVKKDYGNIVHTALAKVKVAEDIDIALSSMCAEGLITNEESDQLKNTLGKIVELPKLKAYFEKGLLIKNEAEIVTSTGELYRPDRVVINGKNAVIIDYKTGEERKKHQEQIIGYSDLLSQMGYIVTERLLVYIESERVILV